MAYFHFSTRTKKILLAAAFAVSLSACSVLKVGYSLAPTLINWQLSGYVTLDEQQHAILDQHVNRLHEWHRNSQLPLYADFLDRLNNRLHAGGPFTTDELMRFRRELSPAWRALVDQTALVLADVTLTLSDAQFTQIEDRIASDHRALRKRHAHLSAPERLENRTDVWQECMKYFFGELSELQQARISHGVAAMIDPGPWWEHRETRLHKTLAMMRESAAKRPPRDQVIQTVRRRMLSYGTSRDQAVQRRIDQALSESLELISQFLNTATPTQLTHARKLFARHAQDLRELARISTTKVNPNPLLFGRHLFGMAGLARNMGPLLPMHFTTVDKDDRSSARTVAQR